MGRGTESDSHPGWFKRTFWYFTCAQSSVFVQATDAGTVIAESYPSLSLSTLGHVLMAVLWTGAVFTYSVFVTYQHFTKPDKEMFMHSPTQGFDPPWVQVEAWCTQPPHCGDITFTADYAGAANSKCHKVEKLVYTVNASDTGNDSPHFKKYKMPLCFTDTEIFTTNTKDALPGKVGLLVDFKAVNPGYHKNGTRNDVGATQGLVRVTSYPDGASEMNKIFVLGSWAVKSLAMGQDIVEKYGVVTRQVPYPKHIQYEGQRPSWRATAIVMLAPYVDSTVIVKKAMDFTLIGFIGLFGTCCGMAFLMNSLNSYLVTFFVWVCPGPSELARRETEKKEKEAKARGEGVGDEELKKNGTKEDPESLQKKLLEDNQEENDTQPAPAKAAAPAPQQQVAASQAEGSKTKELDANDL